MSMNTLRPMRIESEKTRREEYSEATRAALLDAAKRLFTANGYQATGIEAVAQASRVTRGALYHHFTDKRALFDALVVELQRSEEHTSELQSLLRISYPVFCFKQQTITLYTRSH